MRALLLVDIQNDFMPSGRLPVAEGDAIIEPVNRIIGVYPLVVASQDWHPAGHESFASAHAGKKPFDVINLHGLEQVLWPDHCIAGSSGAALHPELNSTPIAAVFRTRDCRGVRSPVACWCVIRPFTPSPNWPNKRPTTLIIAFRPTWIGAFG